MSLPPAVTDLPPVGSELTDFSPSRLTLAGKCGLAFEYKYIRRLPDPYETGQRLFGNVIHNGTEEWYRLGHQNHDLVEIVCAQWAKLLPTDIWRRVQELVALNHATAELAGWIAFKRPEIKAPMQTTEYQTHAAVVDFNNKKMAMLEVCDKLPDIKWPKDEDPYKAYVNAAQIAAQMQTRWQHLPAPIAVEHPFVIEFATFRIQGRIDAVRVDPTPTGEAMTAVVDYKTGKQAMTAMEAFLQAFLYYEGVRLAPDLPTTENVAFYLARQNKYQQGRIDDERHRRLASKILHGRARQIVMGQFEPSYGYWCKRCDFHDLCESEISLWKGDGLTFELMEPK